MVNGHLANFPPVLINPILVPEPYPAQVAPPIIPVPQKQAACPPEGLLLRQLLLAALSRIPHVGASRSFRMPI